MRTAQPADYPHWSDFHCQCRHPTKRRGIDEYCQIHGRPSIRREFYLTWLPMIRPILLRRPPQSNYPPDAVPAPDYGSGLEAQNTKGGIPRLAPRGLASPLHSLPPILDNESQTPTSSCSKGSRGLSVQPRVFGIFTETTISPDPSLRQRPSRYSIRAGRNLPDKEFRYLRTVIVTAAVYWGLDSKLRPKANLSS